MTPSAVQSSSCRCGAGSPLALRAAASLVAAAFAAVLLAGCSGENEDLRQWIDEQRRQAKPRVPPVDPPRKFRPQDYVAADGTDPFSSQKLSVALKQEARQPSSLLASEVNRRKEPLEAFPLDGMSMVGSLVKQGRTYALLRVGNLLYQVKAGDYLGPNYGKITRITETEIVLREIVQDAAGEWIERPATLHLQEKAP